MLDGQPGEVGYLTWNGEQIPVEYTRDQFGDAIIAGDIVVTELLRTESQTEATPEIASTEQALHVYPNHLWPNRVIPYTLNAVANREVIFEAMAHWTQEAGFTFVPRTRETSYMEFRGAASGGCTGTLGRQSSASYVTLGPTCYDASVVIHEIGHVVSLWHEHSRADRDQYVQIHWQNIANDAVSNFELRTPGEVIGRYDFGSVMHYGPHTFSTNGEPTITRLNGSVEVGGSRLTSLTAKQIDKLYARVDGCSQVRRLSGDTRHTTAVAISRDAFMSATHAVIVSGADSAQIDAVTAAPLARAYGGPVLLSNSDHVPSEVLQELRRLGVTNVFVVGGPGVVSDQVVVQLRAQGYAVRRVSGATRFGTASAVASSVDTLGDVSSAFVVSGYAMADAVVASAAGAALYMPVLLVSPDGIPEETAQALSDLGIRETIVIGGPAVVSEAVFSKLPGARRISGADRYATALKLATFVNDQIGADDALMARGDKFVDAIVGGALGRPMLLTSSDNLSGAAAKFLRTRRPTQVGLLGGHGALSLRVENQACFTIGN